MSKKKNLHCLGKRNYLFVLFCFGFAFSPLHITATRWTLGLDDLCLNPVSFVLWPYSYCLIKNKKSCSYKDVVKIRDTLVQCQAHGRGLNDESCDFHFYFCCEHLQNKCLDFSSGNVFKSLLPRSCGSALSAVLKVSKAAPPLEPQPALFILMSVPSILMPVSPPPYCIKCCIKYGFNSKLI